MIVSRVHGLLSRRGLLDEEKHAAPPPSALDACLSQAQLRLPKVAVDEEGRVRPSRPDPWEKYLGALAKEQKLACDHEGFNLHADVRVEADDEHGREALLRYGARPPFSLERLGELSDGRLTYALKKRRKNGQSHVVMTPLEFLARLSALIPPPYLHTVRFHGVLAAGSPWRAAIVPVPPKRRSRHRHAETTEAPDAEPAPSAKVPWAELLKRVYNVDALACSRCGGRLSWISVITEPPVVRRILEHLELPADLPKTASARDPP